MSNALIVIDVQNDFCTGGALAVPNGEEIIGDINQIMPDFEAVVLTQDWHPERHSSFASSHSGKSAFELVEMPYGPQVLWPDHCVQGSLGAEFHKNLDTETADMIVRKGYRESIDSYSGFLENDHVTPTGLDGYLKSRGISEITLVGLALDFCVQFSALDAVDLGFTVTVNTSLCRAIDMDGSKAAAMQSMITAGVILK